MVSMIAGSPDPWGQIRAGGVGAPGGGGGGGGARLREERLAARGADAVARASGKGQHVMRDVLHALLAQRRTERRPPAGAPVDDRGLDRLRRAAPEPVPIGEVGKAARAAAVGGVALRAVVEKEPLPDRERFGIACELGHVLGGELVIERTELRVRPRVLLPELLDLGPAEGTGIAAQPRVEREVAEREYDGDVEQPRPPARQGIVVLAEIPVPGVARGFGGRAPDLALSLRPEQHRTGEDRDDREERDVDAPELAGELAHRRSPLRDSVSSKGSSASRSKRCRRAGA